MSTVDLNKVAEIAFSAAAQASRCITKMREDMSFTVQMKGELDPVTSADLKAEEIIMKGIREAFPDHKFLTEESTPEIGDNEYVSGPLWIIDPIDGTVNYSRNQLQVGVSIAFALDGEMQFGVVDAPFLKETFHASKGSGAFLNGKPIAVSSTTRLKQSLIGTGFPYERSNVNQLTARVREVLTHCQDIRRIGSGALDICWVACGRLDVFYETLSPWDMAAAGLIAREAGAIEEHVTYRENSPFPSDLNAYDYVVSNPTLMPLMLDLLQQADASL
jgi:myo-inositol-1(or 4)-monophosphatase